MLTLYQFELSPFCDKVRRVLQLKGVPYRIEEVPVATSGFTIKRVNKIGKLPCIDDDGRRVADSTHIARYLEERWPSPSIYPADPRERALAHVLEDWADESLYFYEIRLRFLMPQNAPRWIGELTRRENPVVRALAPLIIPGHFKRILGPQGLGRKPEAMVLEEVDGHLGAVEGLLGAGEWLVGGAISIADIAVFAQVHCIRGAKEGEAAIGKRPAVAAWLDRVDRATAA